MFPTMEDVDLRSHGHGIFDDVLGLALIRKYRGDGSEAIIVCSFSVGKEYPQRLRELVMFDVCARLIPNKSVANS